MVASALGGLPAGAAAGAGEASWWIHVVVLLAFLNYLPYSKHIHILGALPNIFFRKLGQRGVLPKLNLEADDIAEAWAGVEGVHLEVAARRVRLHRVRALLELLPRLQHRQAAVADAGDPRPARRDAHAHARPRARSTCSSTASSTARPARRQRHRPGRCRSSAGAPRRTRCGPARPAAPARRSARSSSSTRSRSCRCGRTWCWCRRRCPRSWRAPSPTWSATATRGASAPTSAWTGPRAWTSPPWTSKPRPRVPAVGRLRRRLRRPHQEADPGAGRDPARRRASTSRCSGCEEGCSGDPARRAGNEMLFQMQAQQNVETMNAKKVKKVITTCPHCLHTIKNEYPQFGGNFEVVHHTQLIRDLVAAGKIVMDQTSGAEARRASSGHRSTTAATSAAGTASTTRRARCWTPLPRRPGARHRAAAQPRARLLLRRRRRAHVDGGEDRHARQPQPHRRDPGHRRVDASPVACPFCTIMLTDGVKDRNAEDKVRGARRRRAGRQVDEAPSRARGRPSRRGLAPRDSTRRALLIAARGYSLER